jgi:hypothetical protein
MLSERELWLSLLAQCAEVYRAGTGKCFKSRQPISRSFRWVCDHLQLNYGYVQTRILGSRKIESTFSLGDLF